MKLQYIFIIIMLVLILTALYIAGNPDTPPLKNTISTENIHIESDYSSTCPVMADIYYNGIKIYTINSWQAALTFNNTEKRLHQWFSNSTDPKKVEYSKGEDYEQLMIYFHNISANVTRAGYIFRLWGNETIDITLFADTLNDSKLGRSQYMLKFVEPPESISLQKGSVYENDEKSNHIWKKGLEIPDSKNEFQIFNYSRGSARLDYFGAVEVKNLFEWKLTKVYMEHAVDGYSPLRITFDGLQADIPLQLNLIARAEIFNILIYNFNGKKLPSLSAWESWLNYNRISKRMGGWSENNDIIWFNEHDNKTVEIFESDEEYYMKVFWHNASKDPSMLGYILTNPKKSSNLSITMFGDVKYPEKLGAAGYGIKYDQKYSTLITPSGDVLINDEKTNYQLNLGNDTYVIPQVQSTNKQLFLDSENNMTVSFTSDAPIEKANNLFKWQVSYLFINNHSITDNSFEYVPLYMQVSAGMQKPVLQNNTNSYKIQTSSNSSDKIIHILHNNSKILYFTAWDSLAHYDGSTRSFSASAKAIAKDPDISWFDDSDVKLVSIDETEHAHIMCVSWRNKIKNPSEIGFIFTLPRDGGYIKVQTFINGIKKLSGITPGFIAQDYDVYLPDGTFLENDRNTTYLEYPEYEVLYKNGSAILIYSPSSVSIKNHFKWNIYQTEFRHPSDPLYIKYIPRINLTYSGDSLVMETPEYSGSVYKFINGTFQ